MPVRHWENEMARVDYAVRDGIAWIRLCRAEARNALDDTMDGALADAWQRFEADAEARVAVLHGEGRSFCAGADLKTMIPRWADATPASLRAQVAQGLGGGLTRGRHRLRKPVIAAVHGHAVGRDELLVVASPMAALIAGHPEHAVRSAKETILDLIGRPLDDALHMEAINGNTSFGRAAELRQALRSAGGTRERRS